MRGERILLIILSVGMAGFVQGCGVELILIGAGAAGTIAYVKGDLEAVESAKLDAVYDATLKALDKLELKVTTKSKDVASAKIVARDAQDKKITVRLKAVTEETTKLYIRVGFWGSETKSRLIYQEIHENLPRQGRSRVVEQDEVARRMAEDGAIGDKRQVNSMVTGFSGGGASLAAN